MKKLTFLLLLLIAVFVYSQGQGRYTNAEIDLKIEREKNQIEKKMIFSKEEANQIQEKINNFRKDLTDYEFIIQQQNERISDINSRISSLHSQINIWLVIITIIVAIAGLVGYFKIKRDTLNGAKKDLEEIKNLKENAEKTLKEVQEYAQQIKDKKEEVKEIVEELRKTKEQQPLSYELKQKMAGYINETSTIPEDKLTADDWFIKGYNAADEAMRAKDTNKVKEELKLKEAISYFQKASELAPKDDVICYNLGTAFLNLAELRQKDESLYREAIEKLSKVNELNPKNNGAFNNWGVALFKLGKLQQDESLYREAIEKLEKAAKLNPKNNSVIYNMACVYSLFNKKEELLDYLKKHLQNPNDRNDRNYIENDSDLDNIKSDPKFIELLDKYLPKK